MSLRITGGFYKGLRLQSPSGKQTRPTSQILKEALFNICQHHIEGSFFLDIYAGSGAMGIEALSRGAAESTFIEKDKRALECIHKNLEKLSLENSSLVLPFDVFSSLKKLKGKKFHLVYIDPPYGETQDMLRSEKDVEKLLLTFDKSDLLEEGAWVFLEFSSYSKKSFSELPLERLKWDHERSFGQSTLHLFKLC